MIDILLSTYNGEKYLQEQIESILNQTYKEWRLIIRDDGSNDRTVKIITNYVAKNPEKIILAEVGSNIGAVQSFSKLMQFATDNYITFCDQDDVWLPNKIEKTLDKMKALEETYGKDIPLLVYTNLKVVDENLNILSDSFWRYQSINPLRYSLGKLLFQNVVTGCTTMINRDALNFSIPIPKEALFHDWWLAMVVSAFGKLDFVEEPLVLYRQHNANTMGAKNITLKYYSSRIFSDGLRYFRSNLIRAQEQSRALLEKYDKYLNQYQKDLILDFINLQRYNKIKRAYYAIKFTAGNYIIKLGTIILRWLWI